AREIVHAVQNARRDAGLAVEDRIALSLSGDDALLDAAKAHRDHLAEETLAVELDLGVSAPADSREEWYIQEASVDERALIIALRRAIAP
ncbi:MAG TPA: DUF5915 domain-containing protein, partial [Solirubrobacteraceae bacterium]|nr:DUF5915 domain-containing protein [Solirubrobacteraceae bacterium]